MTPTKDILALARAELAAHPKVRPWTRDALWLCLSGLLFSWLGVAVKGHPHWIQNPGPVSITLLIAVLLTGVLVSGAVLGLSPGRRSSWTWIGAALLSLVAQLVLASGRGDPVVPAAHRCALMELAVAVVPLSVAMWALTRFSATAFQTVAATGCALGAGLLALHLHCPNGHTGHVFLGHILPALGIVLLAWPLRRRLHTWSHAP